MWQYWPSWPAFGIFTFDQTDLGNVIVVFAIMAIMSFTFGVWLVAGGGIFGTAPKEPSVPKTLLGGLFMAQGWQPPAFSTNNLTLLSQMAIPLILITLRVAVARLHPSQFAQANALAFIKMIICSRRVGPWDGILTLSQSPLPS